MSLPENDDEARAVLPVYLPGRRRGDIAAWLEYFWLEERGLLPAGADGWDGPPADAPALLERFGLAGLYEAQVRATGTFYRCPSWCESDHPRAGVWDRIYGEPPFHAAFRWSWDNRDRCDSGPGSVEELSVDVEQTECDDAAATGITVYGNGVLTGGEARVMAAALLNAADVLDAIRGQS